MEAQVTNKSNSNAGAVIIFILFIIFVALAIYIYFKFKKTENDNNIQTGGTCTLQSDCISTDYCNGNGVCATGTGTTSGACTDLCDCDYTYVCQSGVCTSQGQGRGGSGGSGGSDTCLTSSDCSAGFTCLENACVPLNSTVIGSVNRVLINSALPSVSAPTTSTINYGLVIDSNGSLWDTDLNESSLLIWDSKTRLLQVCPGGGGSGFLTNVLINSCGYLTRTTDTSKFSEVSFIATDLGVIMVDIYGNSLNFAISSASTTNGLALFIDPVHYPDQGTSSSQTPARLNLSQAVDPVTL